MQLNPPFSRSVVPDARIKRLAIVSSVALGVIWLLAARSNDGTPAIEGALFAGWLLMPLVLASSLVRPRLLPALLLPSTLVSLGLLAISLNARESGSSDAPGWLLLLSGILLGDLLGAWLWFGVGPLPRCMRDPFGLPRSGLIGLHVALVAGGMALIAIH